MIRAQLADRYQQHQQQEQQQHCPAWQFIKFSCDQSPKGSIRMKFDMRFTYLMTSFHILHNTRFDELTTATPPPTPHQKTSTPTPAPTPSSAVAPSHLLDSRAWLRKFPFPIMATLSSSVRVACVCVIQARDGTPDNGSATAVGVYVCACV